MLVKGLYCPKCSSGIDATVPDSFLGGYAEFRCPTCESKVGVWLALKHVLYAAVNSDPVLVEEEKCDGGV